MARQGRPQLVGDIRHGIRQSDTLLLLSLGVLPQPHRHLPDLAAEDGQFSLLLLGQHLLLLPVENAVNVPAHALQFPVAPPGGAVPDGPADRPQPQRQQAADGIQQGRRHGAHRRGQQQPQGRPPHLRVLPDAHASTM